MTDASPTAHETRWKADALGDGYQRHDIDLGDDPDGEGAIRAVLVRRDVRADEVVEAAVLYVHGFSDYFFQTGLADFFAERGAAFYGLDLRKSGRARRPGHTPHYVSDLAFCDEELETALALIGEERPGVPVIVVAHSTGGLITPLWLDRRRRSGRVAPIAGLVLNSPWFDLQLPPPRRAMATASVRAMSKVAPFRELKLPPGVYGSTLHVSGTGEWDYDLELKPLDGFAVTVGWLNAVRRGHLALHRGLDVGVPSLVLRSTRTHFSSKPSELADRADTVLDVKQIARWAGCLGNETTVVPIEDARHDVFLSLKDARERAYGTLDAWLRAHRLGATG